jgi:hypothetical protein
MRGLDAPIIENAMAQERLIRSNASFPRSPTSSGHQGDQQKLLTIC